MAKFRKSKTDTRMFMDIPKIDKPWKRNNNIEVEEEL